MPGQLPRAVPPGDPAGFAAVPGEKLFFLQLADAPQLQMDVLQWSRHHRLFPGQGAFDLPGFLAAVLDAGYAGPLSLEVFNDVFRQADPGRTAVDAMRSLLWLEEQLAGRCPDLGLTAPPPAPDLTGYAFTELAVDGVSGPQVAQLLAALGFAHTGQHRSKPVQLWEQGTARVLVNASVVRPAAAGTAEVTALGLESEDPTRSAHRATALLAPVLPAPGGRRGRPVGGRGAGRHPGLLHPHRPGGLAGRLPAHRRRPRRGSGHHRGGPRRAHPALRLLRRGRPLLPRGPGPPDRCDHRDPRAVRARAQPRGHQPRPHRAAGAVGVAAAAGRVGPGVPAPQYVAFATDDLVATARALRAAGAPVLPIPANYHDDLDARFDLDPQLLADLREHGLLYDEDEQGAYLHLCTPVLGDRVYLEVVQRIGGYDAYGAVDAPVRMTAHRRARLAAADAG
ncbi:sugar phosphate isomerase/epimerase and 4-hydroxyphenylpyruvate domain-containing protein [Blastococcus brunescens]|uniref:TIM barrel protein n=1 Tax=Blastococcus brunescens TaxID=1564165 RepID=A0ABZ1AU20_9ACTN|nr:TIM barrel protein [Blastococcus sp. BMG 8361]WRL62079.1 TIM barrel protein [Blastococcus sp. BMG 8361]